MEQTAEAQNLESFAKKTQTTLLSVMMTNIVLNSLLSFSLGPLLDLINTLQLVVHFFGINISFPANFEFVARILIYLT